LVGSTALSARMDPEDLRELISAYQKCVAETVGEAFVTFARLHGVTLRVVMRRASNWLRPEVSVAVAPRNWLLGESEKR
jgi:class 3 adenylate cyclase